MICTPGRFRFLRLTLNWVSSRFGAENGEIDVGLPAVDDRVGLLARALSTVLRRHDHLQKEEEEDWNEKCTIEIGNALFVWYPFSDRRLQLLFIFMSCQLKIPDPGSWLNVLRVFLVPVCRAEMLPLDEIIPLKLATSPVARFFIFAHISIPDSLRELAHHVGSNLSLVFWAFRTPFLCSRLRLI